MKTYKKLKVEQWQRIFTEVKLLLIASRDCMWTRFNSKIDVNINPKSMPYNINDGYYGEAFGIMRLLEILKYGYFGSVDKDAVIEKKGKFPYQNLRWWFKFLQDEVLFELNYGTADDTPSHCRVLLNTYRDKLSALKTSK